MDDQADSLIQVVDGTLNGDYIYFTYRPKYPLNYISFKFTLAVEVVTTHTNQLIWKW